MTPLQFVSAECANLEPDGSCRGIMINRDLSMPPATPRPRCLIAERKRCTYFETCVAPMADWVTEPRRAASLQAAVAEYREVTNQKAVAARPCPACGGAMQKGKQRCPRCAAASRLAANRTRQHRHRSDEGTLSRKVSENHPETPMIPGGVLAVPQNVIEDSGPPQNDPTLRDIGPGRAA
jgi:ribosomal protein S27AE